MLIRELIAFLLPPLIAGLIHHFIVIKHNLFHQLAVPIDHGYKLHGRPIFGRKKTYRGIITMTLLTALFMPITLKQLNLLVNYDQFLTGGIIGLFYSLGELPNSFLKRRFNIPESSTAKTGIGFIFGIVDHFDSIIAATCSLFLFYNPTPVLIVSLIGIGGCLHLVVDTTLRRVGYKKIN